MTSKKFTTFQEAFKHFSTNNCKYGWRYKGGYSCASFRLMQYGFIYRSLDSFLRHNPTFWQEDCQQHLGFELTSDI